MPTNILLTILEMGTLLYNAIPFLLVLTLMAHLLAQDYSMVAMMEMAHLDVLMVLLGSGICALCFQ